MSYTPEELGKFLAALPKQAEVVLAVNVGGISHVYWTPGVVAAKSPTGTPEPLRWGRWMLAGLSDATGGGFDPGVAPATPLSGTPIVPPASAVAG